ESNSDDAIAYIDGSYSNVAKRFSYAVILFIDGEKITYSGSENTSELAEMRNVAGELKAAMCAIQLANKNGVKNLKIYYDYAGIEMWATGKWKAKMFYTQEYANYVKKMKEKINITFVKVVAHSGDLYNDEADHLAKIALLGEGDASAKNENGFAPDSNVFPVLSGKKSSINLNIMSKQGTIISPEKLYKWAKSNWLREKMKVADILEIKAYYDINSDLFYINVLGKQNERIYTLRSDEWNGKE
ncbi:MAG: reverse transcriptase-like protein, partial [Clostridiales bacterium]|nr:reverse transcriptase-like protein [Clostridiales bacterium]